MPLLQQLDTPASNLYALFRRRSDSQYRAGASTYAAYAAASYASYSGVAMTQPDLPGLFQVTVPADVPIDGTVDALIMRRAGASPAPSDQVLRRETLGWAVTLPAPAPPGYGGGTLYGQNGTLDFVYTVYDTNGTTPLPGASVYVSSDSAGVQRSQAKTTDALGRVVFSLVPSTVFFFRSHPARAFVNPDSEVVSP